MPLSESELILNSDGSIYHLNLRPEDVAGTIITVGDPERVPMISKYFDHIEVQKGKREFLTHTGTLNGRRLSVISTGIGTDNVDIVLNELDALVNIDLSLRVPKPRHTTLNFVRVGTSGATQSDIPLDSFVLTDMAIGLDGLLHFYSSTALEHLELQKAFSDQVLPEGLKWAPYAVTANRELAGQVTSDLLLHGMTVTNTGFYGPQGRKLRLDPAVTDFSARLQAFRFEDYRVTNLEMETAGLYGMAKLLGHRAVSLNAILANRITGAFSTSPEKTIKGLIEYTLEKCTGF